MYVLFAFKLFSKLAVKISSFTPGYKYDKSTFVKLYFFEFLYISSIILIHHLILFSLETFSFEFISLIIIKTVITSIISLIFCATFIYIMIENEK